MAASTEPFVASAPQALYSEVAERFSLTRGGPTYRLQCRLGADAEEGKRAAARVLALVLLTWAPLLILSLAQGVAYGDTLKIPFLKDFAVSVRFLIALPVLIAAEIGIDRRLRLLVNHFVQSGLVPASELPAFEGIIQEVSRLRDHPLPEVLLFLLAYLPFLPVQGQELLVNNVSTWHWLPASGGTVLSDAGWWFGLVAAPMFRFLLVRWFWRIVLWTRFLWRVSKLHLVLTATHPDLAGGLGFLASGQQKFGAITFAGSTVIAAQLANAIAYQGATLDALKYTIAGYCILAVLILLLPLLFLIPTLVRVKRKGLLEYGALATHYTRLFDAKWIRGRADNGEALLGSGDIQSLADLSNSFAIVRGMRTAPIDKGTLISLTLVSVLPMVPVLFMATPADALIQTVFKLLA